MLRLMSENAPNMPTHGRFGIAQEVKMVIGPADPANRLGVVLSG